MDRAQVVDGLMRLLRDGRHEEARGAADRLMAHMPLEPDVHQAKALALFRTGEPEAAVRSYRRALLALPAHHVALYNLGNALRGIGCATDAELAYRRVTMLSPQFSEAFGNLGLMRQQRGDLDGARCCLARAIALDRRRPGYRANMAKLLVQRREGRAAEDACRRALLLDPRAADAWAAMGLALEQQLRHGAALACNRRALVADPGLAAARNNAALLSLRLGRFAEGWRDYGFRWKPDIAIANPDGTPLPQWRGGGVAGLRLLLWCEQGIGDQVMFLSLVPHLLQGGAEVAVVIEDRMLALVRRSFPVATVIPERAMLAGGRLPAAMDAWSFLGDLPRHLSLFCGGSAAPRPWLVPDRPRAQRLRRDLQARHGGRHLVGITWRSISPVNGPARSIAASLWAPVLAVSGCAFVGLQYGATAADGDEFEREAGVRPDLGHGVEPMTDLDGLAALVAAVDLVICPVNNTIHFAGAGGRAGWNLLPVDPDWRWGLTGSRSRWYPSLTLYRQAAAADWGPVMRAVAGDLAAWAVSRRGG